MTIQEMMKKHRRKKSPKRGKPVAHAAAAVPARGGAASLALKSRDKNLILEALDELYDIRAVRAGGGGGNGGNGGDGGDGGDGDDGDGGGALERRMIAEREDCKRAAEAQLRQRVEALDVLETSLKEEAQRQHDRHTEQERVGATLDSRDASLKIQSLQLEQQLTEHGQEKMQVLQSQLTVAGDTLLHREDREKHDKARLDIEAARRTMEEDRRVHRQREEELGKQRVEMGQLQRTLDQVHQQQETRQRAYEDAQRDLEAVASTIKQDERRVQQLEADVKRRDSDVSRRDEDVTRRAANVDERGDAANERLDGRKVVLAEREQDMARREAELRSTVARLERDQHAVTTQGTASSASAVSASNEANDARERLLRDMEARCSEALDRREAALVAEETRVEKSMAARERDLRLRKADVEEGHLRRESEMKARMEELDMRGDAFKERESRVAVGARTVIVDDANGGQEEQVARAREQREALASLETELHETRSRMEEECTSRDREIERLRTDVRESRHRVISIKDMPNLDISRGGTSVGRGLLRRRRARRHSIASACPSSARGGKLTVGETKNMEAWRPLRSTESGDRDSGGDADRNVRVWRDAAEAKVAAKCRDTESKLSEALGECGDLRERLRSLAEQAEEKQGNREFAIREHKQHVVSLTSQHDTIVTEFHLVRRFGMAAV